MSRKLRRAWNIRREAAWVNARREAALVMLMVLMMSGIAAALIVLPAQLPIDDTVTIAPYSLRDYSRTLPEGRTVNIEVNVMQGASVGPAGFLWFSIMDFGNYSLKTGGSPTYVSFYYLGVSSLAKMVWQVPSDDMYVFSLENPSAFSIRVNVRILWELEWLPVLYAGIALSAAAPVSAIVIRTLYAGVHAPQRVELRGDLLAVPDVVTHAPERLHYVIITDRAMKKCVTCEKDIPAASEECKYCGSRQPDKM